MPTRILIAEDETLVRLDLEQVLSAGGFDVCGVARDGLEAVQLSLALRPELVVLDVEMPRLDGVEAARRILAEHPVPIVMLTAYGYGEVISRAVDAGVAGFVVKPFEENALLAALRTASLRGRDPAGLAYLDRAPEE